MGCFLKHCFLAEGIFLFFFSTTAHGGWAICRYYLYSQEFSELAPDLCLYTEVHSPHPPNNGYTGFHDKNEALRLAHEQLVKLIAAKRLPVADHKIDFNTIIYPTGEITDYSSDDSGWISVGYYILMGNILATWAFVPGDPSDAQKSVEARSKFFKNVQSKTATAQNGSPRTFYSY